MKILIDARLYGLENAGLGRYIINLISGLIKLDTQNRYMVLLRSKYFNELKFPGSWKKVKADFKHYSWEEQIKLPLVIKKLNPDLVHFPHFNVPVYCPRPYVVTIHDMLMHYQKGKAATTLPVWEYSFKRLGYRMVFDRAVREARKIIVPSNTVKQGLASYYKINPEKISVTYEGVDEAEFVGQVKIKIHTPYFMYVGNAYPHKNLKKAIEAIVQLNKEVIFVIVSARNVFSERLKKLINEKGWQKKVRLLGFVSNAELKNLYHHSLGFLYPSLSEGFGLPGLEAMAAGTICLCSDIPVFKEIYQDKVVYFDPNDVNSIKVTLQKVINMTKEGRNKKVMEGKEFVKRYSWTTMAKETLKIYESGVSL